MSRVEAQEVHAHVYGRVQMVMFRDFVQRKARGLRLMGMVCNKDDGSVEVVAQGPRKALERLVEHLHGGPLLARVERIEVAWRTPSQQFDGFTIVY